MQYLLSTSQTSVQSPVTTSSAPPSSPTPPLMPAAVSLTPLRPSLVPGPSLGDVSVHLGSQDVATQSPDQKQEHVASRKTRTTSTPRTSAFPPTYLPPVMEEADESCCETPRPFARPHPVGYLSSPHPPVPLNPSAVDLRLPLRSFVDMPMIHVTVPHPSEMNLIHGWLYNPSPAHLLSALLDLPRMAQGIESHLSTAPTIPQRLSELPIRAILERMQRTHKVWGNVVALGIDNQMLWRVMDRAWDILVSALRTRGGESVSEVSGAASNEKEQGLEAHNEVIRRFSTATIRDPQSRAGSTSD